MGGPSVTTVKRLFAVAKNQCAYPECPTRVVDPETGIILVEVCHIRARSPKGPRHEPDLPPEQVHAFENLILLCGSHHKLVDTATDKWTTTELEKLKADHERTHELDINQFISADALRGAIDNMLRAPASGRPRLALSEPPAGDFHSEDGTFPPVELELMEVRDLLRTWNAVANCDEARWFGSSAALHGRTYHALIDQILLALWRLTDRYGASSVISALYRAGVPTVARSLEGLPEARHLRAHVEHRLLRHSKTALAEPSDSFPGLTLGQVQPVQIAVTINELSTAYLAHCNDRLGSLDPTRQYLDTFLDSFRSTGIPAIDFVPADIFVGEPGSQWGARTRPMLAGASASSAEGRARRAEAPLTSFRKRLGTVAACWTSRKCLPCHRERSATNATIASGLVWKRVS